jgi:manganese-dependent ADP-ribose/CDP-alcohol diphosphatase
MRAAAGSMLRAAGTRRLASAAASGAGVGMGLAQYGPFAPPARASAAAPLFTFGIIADVQWMDADDGYNYARTVKRCYRGALQVLSLAVDWWSAHSDRPMFIAQLGDLIDGQNSNGRSLSALAGALGHLERARCPSINLIGNHELYNFSRAELAEKLGTAPPAGGCVMGDIGDREFYAFLAAPGWRFLVLDPYAKSVIGYEKGDPRRTASEQWLSARNKNLDPANPAGNGDWLAGIPRGDAARRFVPYNGGLGEEQLGWLKEQVLDAARQGERVVVMSHVILHPQACDGTTMVWDYVEALEALRAAPDGTVAAVLCGHDHNGEVHTDEHGVHHLTFCSPLNKGADGRAFGLMAVFDDRLELHGPRLRDLIPLPGHRVTQLSDGGADEMVVFELGPKLAAVKI